MRRELKVTAVVVDSLSNDEVIAELAINRMIVNEYKLHELPIPEPLSRQMTDLEREAKSRRRDQLERALAQAKARKDQYKTREQRLDDVNSEIAAIEAALAK